MAEQNDIENEKTKSKNKEKDKNTKTEEKEIQSENKPNEIESDNESIVSSKSSGVEMSESYGSESEVESIASEKYQYKYTNNVNQTTIKEVEKEISKEDNKEQNQAQVQIQIQAEEPSKPQEKKEEKTSNETNNNVKVLSNVEKIEQEICEGLLELLTNRYDIILNNTKCLIQMYMRIFTWFSRKNLRDIYMLLLGNIQRLLRHINISNPMPPLALAEAIYQSNQKSNLLIK